MTMAERETTPTRKVSAVLSPPSGSSAGNMPSNTDEKLLSLLKRCTAYLEAKQHAPNSNAPPYQISIFHETLGALHEHVFAQVAILQDQISALNKERIHQEKLLQATKTSKQDTQQPTSQAPPSISQVAKADERLNKKRNASAKSQTNVEVVLQHQVPNNDKPIAVSMVKDTETTSVRHCQRHKAARG